MTLDSNILLNECPFYDSAKKQIGKRIIIGGTCVAGETKSVYFAVYNTYYNITEMIYEEPADANEVMKGIEINENEGICKVVLAS